ncbi:hypothetical protein HDV05_006266 [Chytridiales sp. JEL 0842]|nr:hypothetical protein HDV05_006266 [Chytridiales sp. JEL 0842]
MSYPKAIKVGSWGKTCSIRDPEEFFKYSHVMNEDEKVDNFDEAAVSAEQLEALNVPHKVLVDFWETYGTHFKQTWLAFSHADRRKFLAPLLPVHLQSPKYHNPSTDKVYRLRKEQAFPFLPDLHMETIIQSNDTDFKYTGTDYTTDTSLPVLFDILCKPKISDVAIACLYDSNSKLGGTDLNPDIKAANMRCFYVSLVDTRTPPLTFGTYFEVYETLSDEGLWTENCICSPEEFYLLTKRLMNLFNLFLRCADMYRALILHTTRRTKMISLALIGCFKCSVKAGQAVLKACSRSKMVTTANLTENPQAPFLEGLDLNSNGFLLWAAALVFIMTPGLGFFYSGMSRSKNALSMIMLCMAASCVVTIQWVLFGFSLSFSEWDPNGTGSSFIGNFKMAGLTGVGFDNLLKTSPAVSAVAFCLYQLQFANITAALIFGSVAERVRIIPSMVFVFIWTTVVYNPLAYWTWSWRGWVRNLNCVADATGPTPCLVGGLDFAGGGPVHIASGFAGLAFCMVLGKRRRVGQEEFKPHNLANVFLGTALLWLGWFAFNGGSAVAGTARANMAALVTHISAACGALAWPIWDYMWSRRMSGLGFCSGAVAALVAITPAAGFVAPWAAIIIGFTSAIICNMACRVKGYFGFDDALDAWGVHGVGGLVGAIYTGVFAQKWIATLDNAVIDGGWVEGNWKQMGYQVGPALLFAAWSFCWTYVILTVINYIPGLHLRPSEDDEILGGDLGEMGEVAYELVNTFVEPTPEMMMGGMNGKSEATVVV